MKMHINGIDALGLIHSIDTTAANIHDIVLVGNLFHAYEHRVFSDVGYYAVQKQDENKCR